MTFASRLLGAVALGLPFVALAGPADYVYSPHVEYGEREIELKFGTARFKDDNVRETAAAMSFGYGVTTWWATELGFQYEKNPGERTKYDAFEWENRFQLTEPNQYAVDLGLITEIEVPRERAEEGYEFKIGPLVQGDAGAVRWNANLLFERVFRGRSESPRVTEMGYQLQAKVPVSHGVELGVQAFGEMGKWNHWEHGSDQSHRVGPAVFGKVKLGGRQAIKYNAAWLVGTTHASPDNVFRLHAELEF